MKIRFPLRATWASLAAVGGRAAYDEPVLSTALVAAALTITVLPGNGGAARRHTLHCNPAGGTLPKAAKACTQLAQLTSPFAPVPPNMMCTQIYGGPQVAHVKGTFDGRKVQATFNRRGGCEIARWNRVSFLF
jgi:Subtilisin inhibitor-like